MPTYAMQPHPVSHDQGFQIELVISQTDTALHWDFTLTPPPGSGYTWFVKDGFRPHHHGNWLLWEHDVAEVFLAAEGTDHYLEFQVDPNGTPFCLVIGEPRKSFWSPLEVPTCMDSTVDPETGIWQARIRPPRSFIESWIGPGPYRCNAHTCLGRPGHRSYYSAILNPGPRPDFHQPELMRVTL